MNSNRVIGVLLLILSGYIWFTANGFPERTGSGPGPEFFPKLASFVLAFLSIILFFQRVTKEEANDVDQISFTRENIKKFILTFLALILFIVLAQFLGFLVSSMLFIVCWMLIMREKNWKFILLLSIIFSIVITFIFEMLLVVPIPHGFIY